MVHYPDHHNKLLNQQYVLYLDHLLIIHGIHVHVDMLHYIIVDNFVWLQTISMIVNVYNENHLYVCGKCQIKIKLIFEKQKQKYQTFRKYNNHIF